MTITLRIPQPLHDSLLELAHQPVEHAAVLLARLVPFDGGAALLGVDLVPAPEDAYIQRSDQGMTVSSDGYVHALKQAREGGLVAIWLHTHPGDGSSTRLSNHDLEVNEQLRDIFADRTETGQYASLVIGHRGGALAFTGSLVGPVGGVIERLTVVGDRWAFRSSEDSSHPVPDGLFDRNIRAFGDEIQAVISTLTVAVVGAGGTGSSVAEQLVRLGVRSFLLFDPDTLSESNTTRVYGSYPSAVGRRKVDVLREHLERIAPTARIRTYPVAVTTETAALVLREADVVFGCTDDNAGRLRLSRLPYYYLVPLIDCGVQIDATPGREIAGIFGRVTVVCPGTACLSCRDRIDVARAAAEERSADEQAQLEKEGYAPALPGVEPAVVAFTTLVAATAVAELLERLVGYGETPSPSEQVLFIHDRTVRANIVDPRPGHYCDPHRRVTGADRESYLGLNWAS